MKQRIRWTGVLAVVMSVVMVCCAVALADSKTKGVLSDTEIAALVDTTTDTSQVSSPFTAAVASVRSSIVGVRNYQMVSRYNNYYGFGYGYGRNNDNTTSEQLSVLGSGVVVSNYGHILTNYHIVEDATRLTVTIEGSETEYEATVIATDADLDLAVLHVNDLPLTAVSLGDSDQLQVGEWAIVIGNPLSESFARTVTVGIVSALDREVTDTTYDKYGRRTNITNTMSQVDAAINSGNSGGGMFNTLGQLMGIPARKYSGTTLSSTSIDNIGMCIPINVAKPLIKEALEAYTGNTETTAKAETSTAASSDGPKLGVTISTLSGTSAKLPQGAFVSKVDDNSNAQAAGLQAGDIIVEVDGVVISTSSALVSKINTCKEGDVISVKVFRAEGMAQFAGQNSIDLSQVGEGEYIDLTITMKVHAAL